MTQLLIKWFIKKPKEVKNPRVRHAYANLVGIVVIMPIIILGLIKIALGFLYDAL